MNTSVHKFLPSGVSIVTQGSIFRINADPNATKNFSISRSWQKAQYCQNSWHCFPLLATFIGVAWQRRLKSYPVYHHFTKSEMVFVIGEHTFLNRGGPI